MAAKPGKAVPQSCADPSRHRDPPARGSADLVTLYLIYVMTMLIFRLGQSSAALQLPRRAAGQRSGQRSPLMPKWPGSAAVPVPSLKPPAFSPRARVTGKIKLSNISASCLAFTSLPAQAESSSSPATAQPRCSWPADKAVTGVLQGARPFVQRGLQYLPRCQPTGHLPATGALRSLCLLVSQRGN